MFDRFCGSTSGSEQNPLEVAESLGQDREIMRNEDIIHDEMSKSMVYYMGDTRECDGQR